MQKSDKDRQRERERETDRETERDLNVVCDEPIKELDHTAIRST